MTNPSVLLDIPSQDGRKCQETLVQGKFLLLRLPPPHANGLQDMHYAEFAEDEVRSFACAFAPRH